MDLYEQLSGYADTDFYPFHMPGHKRNLKLLRQIFPQGFPSYNIDITEIGGYDNLHQASGILKTAQERAALLYGADHSLYSVGGSTAGILAGIAACARRGDKILLSRNCHVSVYHAVELLELEPVYLMPPQAHSCGILGSITRQSVSRALENNKNIRLAVVTSPTYEGVVSDIKGIAEAVHAFGVPLLVDEAHGAHLGFHPYFPNGSGGCAADLVVQSVHKTLPCFTQTALLHVNGRLVSLEKVKHMLGVFMTSSPSYIFMAGIDRVVSYLQIEADILFGEYAELLDGFYKKMLGLNHLQLISRSQPDGKLEPGGETVYGRDPSKLLIAGKNGVLPAVKTAVYLRNKHHLEFEMTSSEYILAMTSIGDTKEGMERLAEGLFAVEDAIGKGRLGTAAGKKCVVYRQEIPQRRYLPSEILAMERNKRENVPVQNSLDRTAADYIYLYPPGVPLLVPGEVISEDSIHLMEGYRGAGLEISGMRENGSREPEVSVVITP